MGVVFTLQRNSDKLSKRRTMAVLLASGVKQRDKIKYYPPLPQGRESLWHIFIDFEIYGFSVFITTQPQTSMHLHTHTYTCIFGMPLCTTHVNMAGDGAVLLFIASKEKFFVVVVVVFFGDILLQIWCMLQGFKEKIFKNEIHAIWNMNHLSRLQWSQWQ